MKKHWIAVALVLLAIAGLTACSSTDDTQGPAGELISPLDEGKLKVEINQETDSVKFIITDDEGNETVNFFEFFPAESTMHRYYFVSAMGTTYNYYYNYESGQLNKVTDKDDADVSDSLKSMGRWDSAQSDCADFANKIIAGFEEAYYKTMAEAIAE